MEQAKLIAAKLEQEHRKTSSHVPRGIGHAPHVSSKLWTSTETQDLLKELAKHKHVPPSSGSQTAGVELCRKPSQDYKMPEPASSTPQQGPSSAQTATSSQSMYPEPEFIAAFNSQSAPRTVAYSSTASTNSLPASLRNRDIEAVNYAANQQTQAQAAVPQPPAQFAAHVPASTPIASARASNTHQAASTSENSVAWPHQHAGVWNTAQPVASTSSTHHCSTEALLAAPPLRAPESSSGYQPTSINAADVTRAALLSELEASRKREACLAQQLSRAYADTQEMKQQLEHQKQLSKELAAAGRAAREALGKMADQNARLVSAYVATKQQLQTLQVQHQQLRQVSQEPPCAPSLQVEPISLAVVNNSGNPSPFASGSSTPQQQPSASCTPRHFPSATSSAPSSSPSSPRPAPAHMDSFSRPAHTSASAGLSSAPSAPPPTPTHADSFSKPTHPGASAGLSPAPSAPPPAPTNIDSFRMPTHPSTSAGLQSASPAPSAAPLPAAAAASREPHLRASSRHSRSRSRSRGPARQAEAEPLSSCADANPSRSSTTTNPSRSSTNTYPSSSAANTNPSSSTTNTNPSASRTTAFPSSIPAVTGGTMSPDLDEVPYGGESPLHRPPPPVRTASFLRRSTDPERYTCPTGEHSCSVSRSVSDDGSPGCPDVCSSCSSDSEAPSNQSGQASASPRSQALEEAQRQARELQEQNQQLLQAHEEAVRLRQQMEQMQEAEHLKQEGNKAYQRQQHAEAVRCYSKALALPSPTPSFRATLHCNRAAALHSMGSYMDAIADCFHALTLDPSYLRPLQRRADAYCALGDYGSAAADLRKACEDKHANKELLHRLWDVQHRAKSSILINHYAVLGISSASSIVEIKAAYKRLALKYHPDKASTTSEQAAAAVLFRLISSAHTVLTSSEKRKAFDAARLRRKLRRSFSMYHF